jgi:hypothetical protein
MHRIRSNIRSGSRVALFALALQFILSLGHIHVCAFDPDALVQDSIKHAADGPLGGPGGPVDTSDDIFCLICASIQLIASSVAPATPALLLPTILSSIELRAFAEDLFAALRLNPFQARAPPSL